MHFLCEREKLAVAIAAVGHALPTRTTMPVLEGIFMEAEGDTVRLVATDLQKGIETTLEAQVVVPGTLVMPGKLFIEIIRKLPDGMVEILTKEKSAIITCMQSRTTLQTMAAEEYPGLPEIQSMQPIILEQNVLRELIQHTVFAVSTDESRPILMGALLEIEKGMCRMVALDGYRLALRQERVPELNMEISAVVPGSSWMDIAKMMGNGNGQVRLTITRAHLMAEMENTKLITRLLEGEFIKYRQILPSDWQTRVRVPCLAMRDAVERATTFAREGRNNLITMNLFGNMIHMQAVSEMGSIHEDLPVILEGKDLDIAFNVRYLYESIKFIDDEQIFICFNTSVSPTIVKPVEGDAFLYLVLPVRIYGS